MSNPHEPLTAKLVCSVLAAGLPAVWPDVIAGLEDRFGPVEIAYPAVPFVHTAYYEKELGRPLFRRVLAFSCLLSQGRLRSVKLFTNGLEEALARPDGSRRVNLDPGLLTQERFVLATGKNFTHRIYLGDGIFGDLTLVFQAGSWQTLPWTFPDYAAADMTAMLTDIRRRYRRDLREQAAPPSPKTAHKEQPCPRA
ncbi:hypothetical protein DFW101_1478 [Solidesulfovibrio carbinoliphilus subsp. oakridgensis]|uniref:GTP-binding protein n=1 Tax=Solidesulfovibrio carbinoliphilus subsp. oakridgensis TaxID=694327 RepID=G7Q900_9BACT|nr:DUF4416 family protein [Solidesulfovibrio carbinoliphilus]EHJ47486.1 hypothetical protein DFW101_1478 [Solidesulfovibrio carbinoliphilus subsp. oakridgensis]